MLTATLENHTDNVTDDIHNTSSTGVARRSQRITLPLPVRIDIRLDNKISWTEITRLSDVSSYGAGFFLKRPLKRGRLLMLTVPLPRQLRCFDHGEPQYKVWAIVRRCIEAAQGPNAGQFSIGVAFIGKNPPIDYIQNPAALYDTHSRSEDGFWNVGTMDLMADDSDLPKEVRKQTRYQIPEPVILEMINDAGEVIQTESTVTENVSLSGAAIFTQLDLEDGTFLRLSSERHDINIISVVRGRRIGSDGLTRLHVEFIDRFFPLTGIE